MFTRRMLRIKAMQGLYAFYVQQKTLLNTAEFERRDLLREALKRDIEAIRCTHTRFLSLLLMWGDMDEVETKGLLTPVKRHLNDNALIKQLRCDPFFQSLKERYTVLGWRKGISQGIYYEKIQGNETLKAYREKELCEGKEDGSVVRTLCKAVLGHTELDTLIAQDFWEWELYKNAFHALFFTFIRWFCAGDKKAFDLLYATDIFQQEKNFYERLVEGVIEKDHMLDDMLREGIQHWELERVFLLDRILIKMGLVESFLSTPKAVLVNEYLEIAKVYSTSQSPKFIHGVLDHCISTD